jgi:iron complex outermembrane recepter protein
MESGIESHRFIDSIIFVRLGISRMNSKATFSLTTALLVVSSISGTAQAVEANVFAPRHFSTANHDDIVTLDEVVVTSRRRVEKEQEVPAPNSVISGKELEDKGLYQVQDLQQALPNVTSQFLHARQSSLAVRGIGNNTANEGLEGSVGVYLDNVYLGRPGQAIFDLLDLQQIELSRGPQGTLFGKNTTAGVLNISTQLPTFYKEGYLEASAGNRAYSQFKGSVSGPINELVAGRVSFYKTHDDGWVKNLYDNNRLDGIDRQGIRGQILYKPNDGFNLRLIVESDSEHDSTGTLIPYAYGPLNRGTAATNLPIGTAGSNATTAANWYALAGATHIISNPKDYQVNINDAQTQKVGQGAYSAEANWTLSGYTLTSISAWRFWNFVPQNDLDLTNLPGITGGLKAHEDQFSQELRIASLTGGFFDYVAGAYYYHQNVSSRNEYDSGTAGSTLTAGAYPGNVNSSGYGEAKTDSIAIFGQDTLHFTKQFELTTGLRVTSESKKARVLQNSSATLTGAPLSPPYSLIPVFKAWDSGELGHTDNSLAGLLTPSYKFNEQLLGYATLSHGEKSGGYNVNSVASPGSALGVAAITIKPEKANNVELGFKSAWMDNRIQANANLFLTRVQDYQATTSVYYPVTNAFLSELTNVGDLTSKGLEWDIKAAASKNLTLTFNGAYTDARFDAGQATAPFESFNLSPANPALQGYGKGVVNLAGNKVNGAPAWIGNLGVAYKIRSSNNDENYFNLNYALRSSSYGDINNSSYSKIPGYGLLNLRAGKYFGQSASGRWDASVWAKNALNRHYYLGVVPQMINEYVASAGQPLSLGATLRYDFY